MSASSAWRYADDPGKVVVYNQKEPHHDWYIMSSGDIVVGIDESPESRWAVLWAAREARLGSAALTLVRVRSSVSDDRAAGVDAEDEAEGLLSVRAAEASEFEPGITITPRLYESRSISEQLIELSGGAALLVLGVASTRPRADHGVLGPVEDRVVVHAHCPVVTVNGPGPIVGQHYDKIVVGWTEGSTGRRALEAAADEAALRGSLLSVVTVSPTAGYAPAVPDERVSVEQALIDSIRRIEIAHPGLRIDVTHRSGQVVRELQQSLDRAALLVLGSHHSEQPWSVRLGPVVEELMRLSPCPVMLVGRRSRSRTS